MYRLFMKEIRRERIYMDIFFASEKMYRPAGNLSELSLNTSTFNAKSQVSQVALELRFEARFHQAEVA